jgi:hypothetical protein
MGTIGRVQWVIKGRGWGEKSGQMDALKRAAYNRPNDLIQEHHHGKS